MSIRTTNNIIIDRDYHPHYYSSYFKLYRLSKCSVSNSNIVYWLVQ